MIAIDFCRVGSILPAWRVIDFHRQKRGSKQTTTHIKTITGEVRKTCYNIWSNKRENPHIHRKIDAVYVAVKALQSFIIFAVIDVRADSITGENGYVTIVTTTSSAFHK